jgi:uncharacterized protein YgiM (DUF1202 family)
MRSLTLLRGLFLAVVTVATGTLFFSVPAAADSTPFGFYQNDRVRVSPYHSLNTRTYAGTQYSLIATIPADTYGTVQAGPVITSTYVWWRVAFDNGKTGWSVQVAGNDIMLNLVSSRSADNLAGKTVITSDLSSSYLNIRSGPSVFYSKTAQVIAGTVGVVQAGPTHADGYVWWKVAWPGGVSGWSAQRYLAEYVEVDTDDPVITRFGLSTVTVAYGDTYRDDGAKVNDPTEGDISHRLVTSGLPIDTTNPGTYYVRYNATDSSGNRAEEVRRRVTVLELEPEPVADTTPPVVHILGSNPVTVTYGAPYTDAGATAADDVDGDLTASIITSGLPIDTMTPGTHYVRYSVFDSAGNGALVQTRTITVLEPAASSATAVLFAEALGAGWENTSWDVTTDEEATPFHGAYGFAATYTRAWGGLHFSATGGGFNTTGYDTLSFAVMGSTANDGSQAYVGIYRHDGTYQYRPLTDYLSEEGLLPNQWNVVHIPLTDLNARNALVTAVVVESGLTGALTFDVVSFRVETGVCE